MKNMTVKALMLLTLVPSLHGAASCQRLWTPLRSSARAYWQAPRFFSSSTSSLLHGYEPTQEQLDRTELRDSLIEDFYKQYRNTVAKKVGGGIYKNDFQPLYRMRDYYWLKPTKNVHIKSLSTLADTYADIMINPASTPGQTLLALKALKKDQGRLIAAELQLESDYNTMNKRLNTFNQIVAADRESELKTPDLSLDYAHQKQFGSRPNAYQNIINYIYSTFSKQQRK